MATTQTFADMARAAAKILDTYPTLPVSTVSISAHTFGVQGKFRSIVALHASGDALTGVSRWAIEFGSPVKFLDKADYVEVTTEIVVDGHVVVVWDLTTPDVGARLAAVLGVESVADMGAVEPVRLLDVAALLDAAQDEVA